MRRSILNRLLLTCLLALGLATPARATDTQIAVAANFTEPVKEIAAGFQRATGNRAILSFGASGAFYAQIAHGAPFEVFLSADAERPAQAEKDGFAVPRTRFTYAVGRLVLYSPDPALIDGRGIVLKRGIFDRLAIADPAAAPYGLAAIQTINTLGLGGVVGPRLVKGASIAQAFQFVQSGAAQLGFVARSQVIGVAGGSRWLVPANLHAPIEQQAVLLKAGAANPAARAFLAYLRGPDARAVILRYGYEVR